ncbi:MAG: neutral zinc metallopeptidase, partial [Deltaproteobacteria bacterium]|nr:neutral zinc metallopeptidase [Deltaproteobacteria bacterium]
MKWTRGTRNDDVVPVARELGVDISLQRESGREVDPATFTHGTSVQRIRWFRHGFQTGRL